MHVRWPGFFLPAGWLSSPPPYTICAALTFRIIFSPPLKRYPCVQEHSTLTPCIQPRAAFHLHLFARNDNDQTKDKVGEDPHWSSQLPSIGRHPFCSSNAPHHVRGPRIGLRVQTKHLLINKRRCAQTTFLHHLPTLFHTPRFARQLQFIHNGDALDNKLVSTQERTHRSHLAKGRYLNTSTTQSPHRPNPVPRLHMDVSLSLFWSSSSYASQQE